MSDMKIIDFKEYRTITCGGKGEEITFPVNRRKHSLRSMKNHPAFGMWSDRRDIEDIHDYTRRLRKGRVNAV